MGHTLRLTGLVVGDDPAAWTAMGMPVVGDRATVDGVTIRLVGADGPRGVLGWELDPPVDHALDGLAAADATGHPADADGVPTGRRDAVVALDHVVVATPDVERTTAAVNALGIEPRRTVDAARGDDGVRYRFWSLGTCLLELIGPTEPAGDGPATFGGLAFTAPDLRAFGDVASHPRPAIQPGREIVTVRTRELDVSVPVAILSPRLSSR
ncbi:MAG: hypothetical protein WEB09_01520 [Nitriliruptor sp.]